MRVQFSKVLPFYFVCYRYIVITLAIIFIAGCGSTPVQYDPPVQVQMPDSGPPQPLAVAHIPDALPINEPRTKAGNKSPYTVLGKTYHVLSDIRGFKQEGYASWYGNKFHGRKTSNGEIYDMYGMTAAHKTLPIPSFVRVTNQSNNRSVIVRVNDRGPFHGDRIIDLTYTAARKLGFANKGTAKVALEIVQPKANATYQAYLDAGAAQEETNQAVSTPLAPRPKNSGGYEIPQQTYLQLGAFSDQSRANGFKATMQRLSAYPVRVEPVPERSIYRVLTGPLKNNWDLVNLQQKIKAQGHQEPKIFYRSKN